MGKSVKDLEDVTIRFAGDSGDGMQLAGTQFTTATAMVGTILLKSVLLLEQLTG